MPGLDPFVRCRWRYWLYQRELAVAVVRLQEVADQHPDCREALGDRALLGSLARLLDDYVICGVAADLGRCRPRLDGEAPAEPANLDELLAPDLPFTPPSRNPEETRPGYENYFRWFIAPDRVLQDDQEVDGRTAFFQRHPMLGHAVEAVRNGFTQNVREACNRFAADRELISAVFCGGDDPATLLKIEPTGSDFHKGGKQVLILTVRLESGVDAQLVYKPGDVEVDYRLVGNTERIPRAVRIEELGEGTSLAEGLNAALPDDHQVPTYAILPRHPGSGLEQEADGTLDIGRSYGWVEYLTNEPEADEWGAPRDLTDGQDNDWVAWDEAAVNRFYLQFGALLAMASVVSVSDMHLDNVIVHGLRPHLIDLEIAFTGPMADVGGTYALAASGALKKFTRPEPRRFVRFDGTADLDVDNEAFDRTARQSYARNRIFLAGLLREQALPAEHVGSLVTGLRTALEALPEPLATWMADQRVRRMVARFTPYPTAVFARHLRLLYSPRYCSQAVPAPDDPLDREPFLGWRASAVREFEHPGEGRKWPHPRPNFALQTPAHSFRDLLACDIPAYYHRLEEKALLDSRGAPVNANPGGGNPDPGRETYFPRSTWDIVEEQRASLATAAGRGERIDRSLRVLNEALGTHLGLPVPLAAD